MAKFIFNPELNKLEGTVTFYPSENRFDSLNGVFKADRDIENRTSVNNNALGALLTSLHADGFTHNFIARKHSKVTYANRLYKDSKDPLVVQSVEMVTDDASFESPNRISVLDGVINLRYRSADHRNPWYDIVIQMDDLVQIHGAYHVDGEVTSTSSSYTIMKTASSWNNEMFLTILTVRSALLEKYTGAKTDGYSSLEWQKKEQEANAVELQKMTEHLATLLEAPIHGVNSVVNVLHPAAYAILAEENECARIRFTRSMNNSFPHLAYVKSDRFSTPTLEITC